MGFFKKSDLKKNYEIGDQLGSGNFAVVKKAINKQKDSKIPKEVAIKIIDKAKVEDMGDITREIEIMQDISHPNVINLFEIFDEPKKMNLVMELVTGGELFDRIVAKGSYSEKDAAQCLKELCSALKYLHEKKIVHRDLKPENLLYDSPAEDAKIKVADFGLARVVTGKDMMKTACGTPGCARRPPPRPPRARRPLPPAARRAPTPAARPPPAAAAARRSPPPPPPRSYVAPEILKNQGYDSGAVDMWSTGVILYILLCGFPPFYEEELPALFDQILHARYDFPSPWWDSISKEAKSLVQALLTLDPKKRMTADEVLKQPWVTGAASDAPLDSVQKSLRKYNATRKLKKAALGIMAQQRMTKALEGLALGPK